MMVATSIMAITAFPTSGWELAGRVSEGMFIGIGFQERPAHRVTNRLRIGAIHCLINGLRGCMSDIDQATRTRR
jgi:hypothetical protein